MNTDVRSILCHVAVDVRIYLEKYLRLLHIVVHNLHSTTQILKLFQAQVKLILDLLICLKIKFDKL